MRGSRRVANIADESAKSMLTTIMVGYDDGYARTAPVGSYEANPWGLRDVIGNVNEWTADWYDGTYYASSPDRNPRGPSGGQGRVVRGGSWNDAPFRDRSAGRLWSVPAYRLAYIAFRCARDAR